MLPRLNWPERPSPMVDAAPPHAINGIAAKAIGPKGRTDGDLGF
jgi:hypothetical protein